MKLKDNRVTKIDPNYKEIRKLDALLTEAGIPHTFQTFYWNKTGDLRGAQIIYPEDGPNRVADVVINGASYGNEFDLLEMMGLVPETAEPDELTGGNIEGYMTAESASGGSATTGTPTVERRRPAMPKLPSGVSIVTESALPLIFKDGPRGQFLCLTKDQDGNAKICAVDNNTGDAWTEDFNSLTAALYWLENQAATPNEAETYAAAKAAEQYDDPLREEIDRYIESERAAAQTLADQIEHYVNTAHEARVTVQTKVAAILRHNKHNKEEEQ